MQKIDEGGPAFIQKVVKQFAVTSREAQVQIEDFRKKTRRIAAEILSEITKVNSQIEQLIGP